MPLTPKKRGTRMQVLKSHQGRTAQPKARTIKGSTKFMPEKSRELPRTDRTILSEASLASSQEVEPTGVTTPPKQPADTKIEKTKSVEDSTQLLLALQGLSGKEKAEILSDFSTKLQRQNGVSEQQKEKILAAVVMNRAMRELRKSNPKGTKAQIVAASATNPELKKWTNLADRSAKVLKGVKRSAKPDPASTVKELQEAKAKSKRIAKIYAELDTSVREMAKKRLEILRKTHQEIAEIFSTDRAAAQSQFASHSSEFMRITFGTLNKKGQYVF